MSDNDDRGRLDLSRRKLLGAVGTIGGAAALGGAGTMAFFSDTESFGNNSLAAGTLDMKAAYSAHYSDWSPDEGDGVSVRMWDGAPNTTGTAGDLENGETGLPANDAWLIAVDDPDQFLINTQTGADGDVSQACPAGTDADELEQPVIALDDVKPGDFGEVTFDFRLCDNPGYVWLTGNLVSAAENGVNEPESKDPQEQEGVVELLDVVQVAYWIDDNGNNYQDGTETPAFVGSLRDALAALSAGGDANSGRRGALLEGDLPAEQAGGMGAPCFSPDTRHSVAFTWWVPVDHGNEIQSDSVSFDLGFYTEQCRHNNAGSVEPTQVTVGPSDVGDSGTDVTFYRVARAGTVNDAFVSGPDTPPAGSGSFRFATAGNSNDRLFLYNYDYGTLDVNTGTESNTGVALADISELSYSTHTDDTTLAPALKMEIDPDGPGTSGTDDYATLNFEPYYNNTISPNTWQTWDVLTANAGLWLSGVSGEGSISQPVTWTRLLELYPDATIRFGFGVGVGSGWQTAVDGHVDQLTIGVDGQVTTYDFEPSP